MNLVFVHGIAQEHRDPAAIKAEWLDALNNGLRKSSLTLPIPDSAVTLPYYGDKLFELTQSFGETERDVIARGGEVTDPMLQFEAEALEEIRQKAGISDAEIQSLLLGDPTRKGPQNWAWVQAIVRAIDRWDPGTSNIALSLILRCVYVYTNRPSVAAEIDEIVAAAMTDKPTVVVAHSLGTVVAYKILRSDPRVLHMPRFITLGSPLGIGAIRRQLTPLRRTPAAVWFNAFDPRDIVALNPLDQENFAVTPAIENKNDVDNFTENRHSIAGYLSDPVVARGIWFALGGE